MGEKTHNIQDLFLNNLRKKKLPVTIYLANGVKLQGVVSSFDNFSIVLRRGTQVQLVYKHSVATVVPGGPFRLYEDDSENATAESEAAAVEFPSESQ